MTIKGLGSLISKLNDLDSVTLEGARKGIGKSAMKIQKDAKLLVPKNTGELKNSIHIKVKVDDETVTGKVYTTNDHALYVEFGTGPVGKASKKEIPPGVAIQYKDKGWLVPVKYFPNYEQYGMIAITIKGELYVPSRGQKAQQFMTPAAKKHKAKVSNDVSASIKRELKELKK